MNELTPATAALLKSIISDLGNWSGVTPTYNHIDKHGRGNLSDLKKRGLITTFDSDGDKWISVTPAGIEAGKSMFPAGYTEELQSIYPELKGAA